MTKYIIYADDIDHPGEQIQVKKLKREYEAIDFIGDAKNLSRYGCMTLVMDAGDDGRFEWNPGLGSWLRMEE